MTVPAYISDVLTFPVRKDALPMLVIGTVISTLLNFAAYAGILGTLALIIWTGFLCATFFSLILTATNDHAGGPEFADASNVVEDIIVPLVRMLAVFLVAILPLVVFLLKVDKGIDHYETWRWALTIFAIAYFPMAILAVAVLNNITAANPWLVAVSILRTLPYYLLCVILIVGVYSLRTLLYNNVGGPVWLVWVSLAAAGMFVLMATSRALGLLYRVKEDELNWI